MSFNEQCNKLSFDIHNYYNNKTIPYITSGYSLMNLLGILYGGSDGETKSLLENKFHFNDKTILQLLDLHNKLNSQIYKQISFILINNIKKGDYRDLLKPICRITKITDNIPQINSFVKEFTNGLINNLLDENLKSELVLINVIYFKSIWKHKFHKFNTITKTFNGLKNKFNVNMMCQTDNFMYSSIGTHQMIEMDYIDNNHSMCVILQENGDTSINSNNVNMLLNTMQSRKINLEIPRFKIMIKTNFNHLLQNIGLRKIFENLNVPNISNSSKGIQDIIQKIVLDVNEEGSELAIATSVVIKNFIINKPIDFICDKPFVFFIRNKLTNTIICTGKYI